MAEKKTNETKEENNLVCGFMRFFDPAGIAGQKYRMQDMFQEADAFQIADKVSDSILFHRKVRENGIKMMAPLED
jgi:hypothetical protein